jgi:hypothetical protein
MYIQAKTEHGEKCLATQLSSILPRPATLPTGERAIVGETEENPIKIEAECRERSAREEQKIDKPRKDQQAC